MYLCQHLYNALQAMLACLEALQSDNAGAEVKDLNNDEKRPFLCIRLCDTYPTQLILFFPVLGLQNIIYL